MATATGLAELVGHDLGRERCAYEERDAILFALAVGARADELRWVYEERLEVMPTFALTLGLWAVRAAGATGVYDPIATLHVGQDVRIRGRLPRAAKLDLRARIDHVWDKGTAALVDILVTNDLFDATYTIFVPDGGGFGGERGPSRKRAELGEPRWRADVATTVDQAALYRLTGDPHPIHIDPEVAQAHGFKRPILHGLCTLAATAKVVADTTGADLSALNRLSTRLTAPVYPGDPIAVEAWSCGSDAFDFRASAGGCSVLESGEAEFSLGMA